MRENKMKDYEFEFCYPQLVELFQSGTMYVTREWFNKKGTFGQVTGNKIYIFRKDTFERKTTVAINHEVIHAILDDIIGRTASFTFDFIFKKEFLPVVRKLLGRELGFIIGVYHSE